MINKPNIIHNYFASEEKIEKNTELFLKRLKKRPPKNLDVTVHAIHNETFESVDCLDCANCCKTISPGVTDKDIERLAKYLRKKPSAVVEEYFHKDRDGDYIFNESPCPFLMPDNYCLVYDARPKACKEYPHTDRKRFAQLIPLTQKNISVCPAVWHIINELRLCLD